MKKITVAIGTILLASTAAVMTSGTPAAAFRGGGGGGGFHGGGGGFHGGGGGFHGGGLGGFHGGGLGGFHGGGLGGFHGGGLGGFHGGGLGGFHSGGLGGFHGGGFHGVGGLHGAHLGGIGHGGFHAGGLHSGIHAVAGHHGLAATRVAHGFGHNGYWHNGAWHRGFGPGFYRAGVFGWVGPLFWPYAFSDLYCGLFWGYWGWGCADPYWAVAYGDPFWGYGYGDIYGGLFSPFAPADLAQYMPDAPASARNERPKGAQPAESIAQMCGDDTKEVAAWPIDRIQQLVSPDEQQRAALDDLANASTQAAQIIKSGCPTAVAFTPSARLAAMEQRIEAMEQAVQTVRGPLDKFYDSLTDEQKAKFSVANEPPVQQNRRHREQQASGPAQSCTGANAAAEWPEARLEAALRPTEAQQAKLKALQSAATAAAQQLAASCPSSLPTTPPARLAAMSERLNVMLTAVKSVRTALDDLYADLSDEQKAQFNRIGQAPRSRTAQLED
jgi:hypothetical protein